jgi:hypothetical protein
MLMRQILWLRAVFSAAGSEGKGPRSAAIGGAALRVILSYYVLCIFWHDCAARRIPKGNRMSRTLAFAAALSATLALPALAEEPRALVTVVTAAEPQTQLMAMVLTTQAAEQGHSVHVLLCGPGGDLALTDAPDTATAPQPPRDASPQGMLQGLIERGATVEVCAIFLPGLGADESVLIDGVGVAQPPAMAGAMLDEDAVVWSF